MKSASPNTILRFWHIITYVTSWTQKDDRSGFFGIGSSEWGIMRWAYNRLEFSVEVLAYTVPEIRRAAEMEIDAEWRRSLSGAGLKLYDGFMDGTVDAQDWYRWFYTHSAKSYHQPQPSDVEDCVPF